MKTNLFNEALDGPLFGSRNGERFYGVIIKGKDRADTDNGLCVATVTQCL